MKIVKKNLMILMGTRKKLRTKDKEMSIKILILMVVVAMVGL